MKRERLFFPIAVVISFLLPLSCAYDCYDDLREVDFLTRGTKYEAADIDNLLVDKHSLTGVNPPPVSTLFYFPGNFWSLYGVLPVTASPNQPISTVLRR